MGAARPRGKGKRSGVHETHYEDDGTDEYEYSEYDTDDEFVYASQGLDDDEAADFGGYSRRRR